MTDYRQHYRDKTVLVTGGAGAIGSNLCSNLAQLGARIICLDDLSASMSWNVPSSSSITFVQGDILNETTLKEAFSKRPQIVFHLAAFFANQNSVDHPERDLMVNGLGTLRLLQCSVAAEIERFVYASSSSIYGGEAPLPIREESISVNLSTPYQITKLLGELYCNYYHSHYGLKVVKPRLFNSYGPGELPGQYRNVIPNFIYQAMKGGPLTITGTGEETRDFTYINYIVDGLLRLGYFEGAVGQEINLGSGKETSIRELAETINTLTNNKADLKFVEPRRWDTRSRRLADIGRARTLAGYDPTISLHEGLSLTVAWFRTNWESIIGAARFEPETSIAAPKHG